ncbi:helix-turn-helix domain-containing protein [Nocardia sp. NPDC127579]|uniref:AraC family transcriptional regulator n=1 Tax=Nocardia sp. NPDC127579 TaxID=3345402 RepID=UPI0036253D92
MDQVVVGGETVSAAGMPPRDSFAAWEAVLADDMTACSLQPIGTGPFNWSFTPLYTSEMSTVAISNAAPQLARRTARHIARGDRPQVVALLPLAGSCEIMIDDQKLSAPVGSMYIIDDLHPQMERNGVFQSLMIRADRELVLAASGLGEDQFPSAVVLDGTAHGALVVDYFRRLATLPPSAEAAPALLRAGIDLLGAGLALGRISRPSEDAMRTMERERVLSFLHRQLGNAALDVETIAVACRLSRRTVHRLLAEPWGGPMRLLRRLRIERACTLLTQYPDKTVASVAHVCGFSSDRHFYRAFRAETGMSPAEFRRQAVSGG